MNNYNVNVDKPSVFNHEMHEAVFNESKLGSKYLGTSGRIFVSLGMFLLVLALTVLTVIYISLFGLSSTVLGLIGSIFPVFLVLGVMSLLALCQ